MSTTAVLQLSSATDLGLEIREVPTDPVQIVRHSFDPKNSQKPPKKIIADLTIRMIRKRGALTVEQRQRVYDILQSLSHVAFFNVDVEKMLEVKFILKALMGEWPKASGPYAFPDPFPDEAAQILERVENDLGFEQTVIEDATPSPSPPPTPTLSKKRKRPLPAPNAAPRRQINLNDPTVKSIFYNIEITDNGNRRSYKLKDKTLKIPSNVVGNNGLEVGQWWPLRICALQAGAHGAMQGGIAGGATEGTFSIVVSHEYEGMDKDEGNGLLYSGSNSHDNEDHDNYMLTHATKGMRVAYHKRRSMRVIRTSGSSWKGAPSVGLRYDGLYTIVEERRLHNDKGGAYLGFKLKRNADQPDIDTSRPNRAEKEAFNRLKESI